MPPYNTRLTCPQHFWIVAIGEGTNHQMRRAHVLTLIHGASVWVIVGLGHFHSKWSYVLVELRDGNLDIFLLPQFSDYKMHYPYPNLGGKWGCVLQLKCSLPGSLRGVGSGEAGLFSPYYPPLKPRCILWSGVSYSLKNTVISCTFLDI